jgi:hypothetical protein
MTSLAPPHRRLSADTITAPAGALAALLMLAAAPASAAPADAAARAHWRDALARISLPSGACFKASYPDIAWTRVACGRAPQKPYIPRHAASLASAGQLTGDGKDYAAVVSHLITQGAGSFPSLTGLKTEKGSGESNTYSLQLNSNFFTTTVCNGASNPSSCLGWQQFVYSNSGEAFMQYWLLDYGNRCPSGGWMAYSGDCYRNSAAVDVPVQALTQLADLAVTGTAVANGTDKMVLTTATSAYTTTGADSVVRLAEGWTQSEYNVVGDGGGSEAKFNTGTSITVMIALTDGATTAPICEADDGTTGETNNLNLGACTTFSGATPSVSFVESH